MRLHHHDSTLGRAATRHWRAARWLAVSVGCRRAVGALAATTLASLYHAAGWLAANMARVSNSVGVILSKPACLRVLRRHKTKPLPRVEGAACLARWRRYGFTRRSDGYQSRRQARHW
jgi:hypothetical protein